jgi:macrolide-specific efflux system membrane fusion protein
MRRNASGAWRPPWERKRLLAVVAVVVVAAGGVVAGLKLTGSSGSQYRLTPATLGTVEQTSSLTGTIEPVSQADLNFGTSGMVATVAVTVGQTVTAGTVVATLDSAPLAAQVYQDQAAFDQAESQLNSDESSSGSGVSAYALAADRASVAFAQSTLSIDEANLADARLISPISGTVIAVDITSGAMATQGATTVGSPSPASGTDSGSSSSTAAVEVVSPGAFEVHATASATQVAKMKVGDHVAISPTGATSVDLGTVTEVGTVATVTSGVPTFPVTVVVTGTPPGLYEGATADLTIVTLNVRHVLTVPSSAVHTAGARSFVYVLSGGKEVARTVTVGAVGGTLTQIKTGLRAGQEVVLANLALGVPGSTPSGRFGPGVPGGTVVIGPGSGFSQKTIVGGG